MSAAIHVIRLYGATPSFRQVTGEHIRLSTSDNDYTTETSNPIPAPSAAAGRPSYWVATRAYALTDSSATVKNLNLFTKGTDPWAPKVKVNVWTTDTYHQAEGIEGVAGYTPEEADALNGWGWTLNGPWDLYSFTRDNPLLINGTFTTGAPVQFGDYVILQAEALYGASSMTLSSLFWGYDES